MARSQRFRSVIWIAASLAVLLAAGAVLLFLRHGDSARPAGPSTAAGEKVPVDVVRAEKTSYPVHLLGLGSIQSFNTVTVRSRVDGEIVQVNFKEGQSVSKGDVLLQIDPRPYQAALDQAVAKQSQDDAQLQNAKLDLQRYDDLLHSAGASRQQRDTQAAQVRQFTALVALDQAAIEAARVQLDYTTIRSPITGRVGFSLVTLGNIVHAADQTGVVTVTEVEPIAAVFTAPEDQLPAIEKAFKQSQVEVAAMSADGSQALALGTLSAINNQVDQATGTIQLKASFENKDNALWPGQSVSTRLLVTTLQDVVVIPQDAVQRGPDGYFAYLVGNDDKVTQKRIKVDQSAEGKAVVSDGIQPGDRVVVSGQYRIQAGTVVAANDQTPAEQRAGDGTTTGAASKEPTAKD